MSRFVWPYVFTLRATGLVEAARQQKVGPVREKYFQKSNGLIPVALRWATTPDLGFPREPFQVCRRQRDTNEKSLYQQVSAQITVNGQQDISAFVTGDLAYIVLAPVAITSGSVTIQALDINSLPIPGQSVTLSGNGLVEFRCPGINALRVFGTGKIGPLTSVGETAYANLPDWQKIQTVGLPLKKGELGGDYNTLPQGFEPPTMDGVQAAQIRTAITALLALNPPATGIADFPVPPWPVPDSIAYITNIRGAKSMVGMIGRCLHFSIDTDVTRLQKDYVETVTLDGIKQASLPGATADPAKTTSAQLPIPGVAMMAVSTDSYSAVSLGYGTVDIPPIAQPTGAPTIAVLAAPVMPPIDNYGAYDYMVAAPYVFPFGLTAMLAALSTGEPPVQAPFGLTAKVKQVHAPVKRNEAAPAAITVSWQPSQIPEGYGILVSRKPNQSEVLNASRPAAVHGFDPFVGIAPTIPDPNTPPDQQIPNFSDTACHLPLDAPPITDRYLVAGLDVFGQWSNWVFASASLNPAPITKPGIRNVEFLMDPANAVGHAVTATLRVEFAWDWEDRSPGQIRLTGQFIAPGSGLGPAFLGGLAMKNGGPVGPPAILTFNYVPATQADTVTPPITLIPAIDPGHVTVGPVQILQPNSPDPTSSQVQYRVDIKGFTLDFSAVNEIDFALYITATESIRPGQFGDATDPVMKFIGMVSKAHDPIPPVITFAPPSISWTALPDATGTARGILSWTPDPKAVGYYVWEATESALRNLLAPNTPDPLANTPLVTRGGELKTLINGDQDKSLQAFARLNKDPIVGSRTEIKVPAAASTLYVYRVSAISTAKVEASRSAQVAVFGVPRRNVPGVPRLMLRPSQSPQGILVIALPVESGAPPAGYRVFRCRSSSLSLDGSTMGPAKLDENNAGWKNYSSTTLAGKPLSGRSVVDTVAIPSWYPYYYRITAIGVQDLPNGLYAGESGFSGVQSGYSLPGSPPMQANFVLQTNINGALVTLTTDLPAAAPSPVGPALVEVLQVIPDAAHPGRMTTKKILSSAPDKIIGGVLHLPVAPPPPPPPRPPHGPPVLIVPPHPPITGPHPPPVPIPSLARSVPDASGHWTLYVLIPYAAAQKDTFLIRLTDPLARRSNTSF
jgi:hypothetical protein